MSESANGSGLREHLLVFSRFLRSPRTVGAVSASSRALANEIVHAVEFGSGIRIVELGPGTGALTVAIVERLTSHDRFLAVDIDPEFVKQIRQRWPSIECICASAEDLVQIVEERGLWPLDHIVSGLPFTSLPVQMTDRILESVAGSLRPGGTFTTFQYVYAHSMPSASAFRRKMSERMRQQPSKRLVVRNVPPAWILTWKKPADGA
ncbi:MAG TPA: methyltransferase domain-containing protein [Vicinamibacterales bacterium]|nr:methyltransferase domain-containing protein [Vicinamibacterales bacterium]